MKKLFALLPLLALSPTAQSSIAYGALSNFDAVNDTGQIAYGFEIEIDGIHSTAIGGTYSWNHYGVPKISEDNSNPANPKVFIRYEATSPSGFTTGFTNVPTVAIAPTGGHLCTNPYVNEGCEHFGVGVYSSGATAYKYNWLVKDATGNVVLGPAVNVGAPVYVYQPPIFAQPPVIIPNPKPNLPPIVQKPAIVDFPAQVVAVIPAPVVPIPPAKQFGEPSWVKVIKTTAHNDRVLALEELVGDDKDGDHHPDWTNGEPDEVESEWYLLQKNNKHNGKKDELAGKADDMDDGRKIVTRRYEFYEYVGPAKTIDVETGEAMCDAVQTDPNNPNHIPVGNGIDTVGVTQNNPDNPDETKKIDVDCSQYQIVGAYRGAQMGEFNAIAPLSLINDIQSGNVHQAFPQRAVVFGGNTPYETTVTGKLPNGLSIDSATGVLSGVPTKVGIFNFTVDATDADQSMVSNFGTGGYIVKVTGPGDVDGDFDIDSADLAVIKAKYGQNVLRTDPANLNGDLKINLLDYRKAASLCTKPRCALVTP